VKKALITILVISVIAFAVYYFLPKQQKEKLFGAKKEADLPPAATPPISQGIAAPASGLYETDSGVGKAAVEKRQREILENENSLQSVLQSVDPAATFFDGTEKAAPFFVTQVSQSTGGAGVEFVPFVLSPSKISAIESLKNLTYQGPGYWDTLKRVVNAANTVREKTGVRILAENMYNAGDLNPVRNDLVHKYIRPDKKKDDAGAIGDGTQKLVKYLNALAANWLQIASEVQNESRQKAIQDLRQSGWRFVGYDSPN